MQQSLRILAHKDNVENIFLLAALLSVRHSPSSPYSSNTRKYGLLVVLTPNTNGKP